MSTQPRLTHLNSAPAGLPGQAQKIIVVMQFKDPSDPRNVGGPRGLPGQYRVTFVLSRPGIPLTPENQYSFADGLKGDSHLAITRPAFLPPGNPEADRLLIGGVSPDGQFQFTGLPNERGFLGKVVSEPFNADGFSDAEQKAYRALVPSLSNWSVHLDVPLHVHQIESTEIRTGNTQTSMTSASMEAPCCITPTATLTPQFLACASLYREALTTNSPPYQFMCLFKVMEAIRTRRSRLGAEARSAGTNFIRPVEIIPAASNEFVPWLDAIFSVRPQWGQMALDSIFLPEALGKRFTAVFGNILNPLRVKVAHALSSASGELTLSADEMLHIQEVNKWLPLSKCMVRRMLKNEFSSEFLSYLKEDGAVEVR